MQRNANLSICAVRGFLLWSDKITLLFNAKCNRIDIRDLVLSEIMLTDQSPFDPH